MANKGAIGRVGTENLTLYLNTNDITVLENKPLLDIPYPDARRLAAVISMPTIRALLPPALVGEASAGHSQDLGLARVTGRGVVVIKEYMMRWGSLLVPAGLMLFLLGCCKAQTRFGNYKRIANTGMTSDRPFPLSRL